MASRRFTGQRFALPAGDYVIVDPCYVLNDDHYQRWLDHASAEEKRTGQYPYDSQLSIEASQLVTLSTEWGDGRYDSNMPASFPVDSGNIGCIPTTLVSKDGVRDGMRHTFTEAFECYRDDNGTLHFGDVEIYTGNEEEDDLDG